MCVVVFGAIELAQVYNVKSTLQNAADSAALAAAREISVMGSSTGSDQTIKRVVNDMFFANSGTSISDQNAVVTADYVPDDGVLTVDVTVNAQVPPLLRYALKIDKITAQSKARIAGKPNVCVLGLDGSAQGTVTATKTARIVGKECAVYSNSSSSKGVSALDSAVYEAQFTCSKGGVEGNPSQFLPSAVTDCPKLDDPLDNRPEPANANAECDPSLPNNISTPQSISPGVYCGGLNVNVVGKVTMLPGTYIVRDGTFTVSRSTELYGRGVSIHLKGANASMQLTGNSDIDLEAPTDGERAGILVSDSRSQTDTLVHKIRSPTVRRLVGVLYFPNTSLEVNVDGTVAEESPWTALIARKVSVINRSKIVLNADFASSPVPVPVGIKGSGGAIRLIK